MNQPVTFLQMLNLELQALGPDDYYEPDFEINPSDNQVGTMSENLVRLYSLLKSTQKLAAEKGLQINFGRLLDDQKKELVVKYKELGEKADLLGMLFWVELKEEHKLWDKPSVGVRKGRIVIWGPPPPPTIISFPFGNMQ